ncbi:hypothetical protein L7F22_016914 [Adiantum nelumboides]|nr:hypothetical protein [Adiantum nelumboides]
MGKKVLAGVVATGAPLAVFAKTAIAAKGSCNEGARRVAEKADFLLKAADKLNNEDAPSRFGSGHPGGAQDPFRILQIAGNGELETSQSTPLGSCPLAPEEEVEDVEVQFDPKEEQLKVSKETIDAGLALASLVDAAIGCKQESPNKKVTLPLNCTPTFAMAGNTHYVLLTNIMHELNIWEDCYLAAIVNFCEADMGFMNDDEVDQHLIADTTVHDSQFTSRPVALRAQVMNSESIHLWGRSVLEMDENHMVLLYDDSFLRRAGGSRQGLLTGVQGKDAALSHYIKRFNHKKIIIYHKDYSEDNAKFPLEVITRLWGGHPLPLNTERLILIEKQFSLCVFGIGYGCQALRAPHFMSYTAQAVVAGVEDPKSLDPYSKRLFLRKRRCMMPVGMLPSKGTSSSIELAHRRVTK